MNNYQKNVLSMEYFFRDTAVANIGGVIRFEVKAEYEDFLVIVQEMVRKTPSLRLRLNREKELYEYPEEEYILPRTVIHGGYEEAFAYAEKQMQTPFSSVVDGRLFQIEYIGYDDGCAILCKLHHLIGDAASIGVLCQKADEGYRALCEGKE